MKQKDNQTTKQGHSANMLLYAVAPQPKLSTDAIALEGAVVSRGNGIGATSKPVSNVHNELYLTWKHIYKICYLKSSPRYEGVPCQWHSFEEFYYSNIKRYRNAKRKWKNIHKTRDGKEYKVRNIKFVRKIKSRGFTKSNTVFTSLSDGSKYAKTSYLIIINKKQLGTRDAQNILKKKGINLTQVTIANRLRKQKDIFEINRMNKYLYKGKYQSTKAISKHENISCSLLKNKIREGLNIDEAVAYCKSFNPTKYCFEGAMLKPFEIANILYERLGISKTATLGRITKWGYNEDKLKMLKSDNPKSPYPKQIIAEKNGHKQIFNSISECCKQLGINSTGNASSYANGKRTGLLKGYKLTINK